MSRPTITVFGSSAAETGRPLYELAYELGRAIGAAGWALCNGGYSGTMEAAARGACETGGHTIGVTCAPLGWRGGPNRYIRQEESTADLLARLRRLVELGDAYVALPGGTGTLLEIALVWELANKRLLTPVRPLILLGPHWTPVVPVVLAGQPEAALPLEAVDVAETVALLRQHFQDAARPG